MKYYRVKKEFDNRRKNNSDIYIANELYTEKEAQKKVSAGTLTFEKTIELTDSDSQFSNTINYRHYNLIRK